jgi:glutamate synthase (ferredoxin)
MGFVVNIKGKKSHTIVRQAIEVLVNLQHRGACGCEANTGDGAGILIQMPDKFIRKAALKENIDLPEYKNYGVAMIFMPSDSKQRGKIEKVFEKIVEDEGQKFLGWRTVPTDNSDLGNTAKSCEPVIRQAFIGRNPKIKEDIDFERILYVIRSVSDTKIRYAGMKGGESYYLCSISYKTIVYKGMLTTNQLDPYYADLSDTDMQTAIALVHSRFSTNTFPSWDRAHPYRYVIHNGEINTLRGNINWMNARQAMLQSDLYGDDITKIFPIINPEGSDSSAFGNCLEFLTLSGRPIEHAVMMMIPEPWSRHESMSEDRKELGRCSIETVSGHQDIT